MLALLSGPPFSRLPLHIRCFTEYAHAILMASPQPAQDVSLILDLGGVSGSTGRRRESTLGATSQSGPIDVTDSTFRSGHWEKWAAIRKAEIRCEVCDDALDPSVRQTPGKVSDRRFTSTWCFARLVTVNMSPMYCVLLRSSHHQANCCPRQDTAHDATPG
jgi:hypothetical protein